MSSFARHGSPPFGVAVLHGGPGAAGEAAGLADLLAKKRGVLEPYQAARSLDGQVDELARLLRGEADIPAAIVGHSWGAMLGFIVAARHPDLVRKLVMVSSGVFDDGCAPEISATRLSRMSTPERVLFESLVAELEDPAAADSNAAFARLGKLLETVDAFDPVGVEEEVSYDYEIFAGVWPEVEAFRAGGGLLALAERIACPVVAVHGDYDPHPARGIEVPLAGALDGFGFFLLVDCGHKPWAERRAREEFLRILEAELG